VVCLLCSESGALGGILLSGALLHTLMASYLLLNSLSRTLELSVFALVSACVGNVSISVAHIQEVDELFLDAKRSATLLRENQEGYLR
jgi:DNA helicase TIP49 (TBP-interacting protein)